MGANINDLDYTVSAMFNNDGTRRETSNKTNDRIARDDEAYNLSVGRPPVKNTRSKKRKPAGIKDIGKKIIIMVALGAGLTIGIHELKQAMEVGENANEIKDALATTVSQNTSVDGYNHAEQRPYWWYDMNKMASDVLNNNKEYDIDTRIYGCFRALNEYDKTEHMNELFSKMSSLIADEPGEYTEDEIRSALHSSFQEYLDSKSITLDEYETIMEKVIKEYAKEDISQEKINDLLDQLNGSRDGGSR